ncbi:c-type cytochrome biogenesis protein CcsB [Desulfobotulus sp. H1]|uniref:C-type cytochrome biogenesis protein CcsB n=1 Tax=Desulfobotulus pelophilus TaxID=2823377 RepID=A0ABT3NAV8_9BACT|nr:c-type cytochrome biogenesis protein CcsB [Desulfobotulus pelophilus]MCW7754599.1 c-type cytochrome biogenesis protein CcsB [Desulfobotulus pelophilus]
MSIVVILYALSTLGYLVFLLLRKEGWQRGGFVLLCAGFLVHAVWLGSRWVKEGHLPLFDLSGNLSFSAFIFAGVFIALRHRYHVKILGIFVASVTAGLSLAAWLTPSASSLPEPAYTSLWVVVHVAASFAGNAAFTLAFAVGVLYLLLERRIKEKRKDIFFRRLPSLELLDATGHACILVGFTFMTLGLATGILYARTVWGQFWSWDPKEVWSLVVWLVYAALLHGRLSSEWRGRKAARMAIVGFLLVLFTFLGVNFLLMGHHEGFTRIGA